MVIIRRNGMRQAPRKPAAKSPSKAPTNESEAPPTPRARFPNEILTQIYSYATAAPHTIYVAFDIINFRARATPNSLPPCTCGNHEPAITSNLKRGFQKIAKWGMRAWEKFKKGMKKVGRSKERQDVTVEQRNRLAQQDREALMKSEQRDLRKRHERQRLMRRILRGLVLD